MFCCVGLDWGVGVFGCVVLDWGVGCLVVLCWIGV